MATKKKTESKKSEKKSTPPKAEKPPKEKRVSRIKVSAVKEELLDKYIAQFALKLKDGATVEDKIRALAKQQRETTPGDKLSTPCTECGGESSLALDECPFCGATEIIPKDETPGAEQSGIVPVPPPSPGQPGITPVVGGEVLNGGALSDLEANEEVIRQAKAQGVRSYWEYAKALKNIYEHNLWQQRVTPDGKAVYRSWGEYCKVEQDMSSKHAMELMEVSQAFDRETFVEIGVSRLRQVMRYEGDDRVKLLDMAKDGATKAQILQYVKENPPPHRTQLFKETVDGSQLSGPQRGGFRGGAEAAKKGNEANKARLEQEKHAKRQTPNVKPSGEVTAVFMMGNHKVKLFTKKDPKKRASTLAQEPVGSLLLANGHELRLTLGKDASGLYVNAKVIVQEAAAAE